MFEDILIVLIVFGLLVTESAGVLLRRWGFITISEQARKTRVLRLAVSALFIVGLIWWQVHSV